MSLTAEQIAQRRLGIGSSDIAAIVGEDRFRNAINIFNDKVYPVEETQGPATGWNPARWGHRLEGLIVEEWATIKAITNYVRSPGTVQHPKHKLALATPDALVINDGANIKRLTLPQIVALSKGLCEAKAPGLRMAEEWEDDQVPRSYLVQTQWQLGVLGLKQGGDLCALIGGQDFRMRAVESDPETFGLLLDLGEKFWRDHVITKRPPTLDGSEAAAEYIRRRFPKPKVGMMVLADQDPTMLQARALEQEIRTMGASEESAKVAKDGARNRLKELVGEALGIEGVCTFKEVEKSGYTVEPVTYRELRLARKPKEKKQ